MPLPPIMKIESNIESRSNFFCKKLLRINHTICFKYSLSRAFLKSDIHFYFKYCGFKQCDVLSFMVKKKFRVYTQSERPRTYFPVIQIWKICPKYVFQCLWPKIVCSCYQLTVIKFVLLLEYRLGNKVLVEYSTIV